MSKRETPITEGFWLSQGRRTFFAEYPLVRGAADRATRLVDGLILPEEPHGRGNWRNHASLSGRRVIVIQTKVGRMGMYLMGQHSFRTLSARLRCSVRSFNFIVPSARWCIAPTFEAISRSRSLVVRSKQSSYLQTC